MFPHGQNYANLCQNPPVNLNVKVTQKRKSENLLHGLPLKHAENLLTKLAQMLTSLPLNVKVTPHHKFRNLSCGGLPP